MSNYIEIALQVQSNELKEVLIVMLNEIGFEGFEEDRDLLKAFIPEKDFDKVQLDNLVDQYQLTYSQSIIGQKNWNELWEAGYDPVVVGNFCAVRAEFHGPVPGVLHEIIITPKMSFGTGHHATTFMMISAMEKLDFNGKSVLDFGTGTGVLAILAEKSGAFYIEAIDYDEWSIHNAKENILMNHCVKISLQQSNYISSSVTFDIILANINKNIILEHFPSIQQHLSPGGKILLSGLLENDLQDIINSAIKVGLKFLEKSEQNSWICILLSKSQ